MQFDQNILLEAFKASMSNNQALLNQATEFLSKVAVSSLAKDIVMISFVGITTEILPSKLIIDSRQQRCMKLDLDVLFIEITFINVQVEMNFRQAAAVQLYRTVQEKWPVKNDVNLINNEDRETLKQNILEALIKVSDVKKIQ